MGIARILHYGLHVLKVQVHNAGQLDQIRDALHALAQHIVRHQKGVGQGDALLAHQLQALVGDDHQGVHMLPQLGNAPLGLLHTPAPLKSKGLGDNAHCQRSLLPGHFGHGRGCAGASAAAHTGGDEHHVRVLKGLGDNLPALLSGLFPHLRLGARAPAVGQLLPQLHLDGGLAALQGLLVRIHTYQLHTAHTGAGNAVYSVSAATANSHHFNGLGGLIQ